MTFETEEEAKKHAQGLLREVEPMLPGAHIRVHENLGWHGDVVSKYIRIHRDDREGTNAYRCYISRTPNIPGANAEWGVGCGPTAVEALVDALRAVREWANYIADSVRDIVDSTFGSADERYKAITGRWRHPDERK